MLYSYYAVIFSYYQKNLNAIHIILYTFRIYIFYTYLYTITQFFLYPYNKRAIEVITRIQAKLTGRDFHRTGDEEDLEVDEQVTMLIQEATRVENLCQLYSGWCPLW